MTTAATTAEFFTALKNRKKELESTIQEQGEALVIMIADGRPPESDASFDLLQSLGKTPEDLMAAATKTQRCRALQKQIRDAEAAQAEIPAIEDQINSATARFEEARAAHGAATAPLYGRLEMIKQLKWNSDMSARGELDRLSSNCRLAKSLAANRSKAGDIRQQMARHSEQLDDLNEELRRATGPHTAHSENLGTSEHPENKAEREKNAVRLETEITAMRAHLASLKSQVDQLELDDKDLSSRLLTEDLVDF